MKKEVIFADKTKKALGVPPGPFSWGVKTGDLIWFSGQASVDARGNVVGRTIGEQYKRILENIKAILEDAGASINDIVKLVEYFTLKTSYNEASCEVAKLRRQFFKNDYFPTVTQIQINGLLLPGELIEVDAYAIMKKDKEVIFADKTKKALGMPPGPFSWGVKTGDLIWFSGQASVDARGNVVGRTIGEQYKRILENIKAILEDAGASMADVVKWDDFWVPRVTMERATMDEIYHEIAQIRRSYYGVVSSEEGYLPGATGIQLENLPLSQLMLVDPFAVVNQKKERVFGERTKKVLSVEPSPISWEIKTRDLIWFSGNGPFDTNFDVVGNTIAEQYEKTMENLKALLEDGGLSLNSIVKIVNFISADVNLSRIYPDIQELYKRYFKDGYFPASTTVQIKSVMMPNQKLEVNIYAVP